MRTLSLIVEQQLAAVPGGTGRYTEQIATALAATRPPGWDVRGYVAWHRNTAAADNPGVAGPHRLPLGSRALAAAWQWGLPPWPTGAVVHALTPLLPAGRAFWRSPLVVTVHDVVPWSHPETLTPRGVQWHRTMIQTAVRRATAIVVPTEAVGAQLGELFPGATGRIHPIHLGISTLSKLGGLLPDHDRARLQSWGLPTRYVLILATLEPRKGLDTLIAAMSDSESEAGRTDLVVVGQPGWGGMDVAGVATGAGMDPARLHLMGRLSDEDLAVVLRNATVLAAPSRAEGFGLPVIEAFAAGVPVVCSDAPALVEVAGRAAVIVPRGNVGALSLALSQVLTSSQRQQDLRKLGLVRAADFSWPAAAGRLWELYQGIAAR